MTNAYEVSATHRCMYCGAHWRSNGDGTWSLVSGCCGQCCDNVKMGHQIVPLDAALAPRDSAPADSGKVDAALAEADALLAKDRK